MNHSLTNPPTTDPAQLLRYRDGLYAADLLAVAITHLDFFTWMAEHPSVDTAAILKHFGFQPRPTDVLLTLCRANGLLRTDAHGRHELSDLAREHLVAGSPWHLGPYYAPIQDSPAVMGFLDVLRSGKPANWQARADGEDWHQSMLSEDFARSFTQLMDCRGRALGQVLARALTPLLADRTHLLDVGGGSGIYASTMLAAQPGLRATVLEQAPVDVIARQEIERHGLGDRIDVVTADMFDEPWPTGSDVLLLSNVLHDWDVPQVSALLERAAEALPIGGLLIIHEAFLNDEKTGPLPVAEYSALLMSISQGKCYTPREYGAILAETGFDVGPYSDTIADRGFMTARRVGK